MGDKFREFRLEFRIWGLNYIFMTIVERRIYPRYDCAFQVRLVDSQDQSHLVNADNISLNGIALSIDQSLKNTLLDQGCHLLAGDSVKIYLPNPDNGPDNSPDTGSGQEQILSLIHI